MDDFEVDARININFKDVLGLEQFLLSNEQRLLTVETCHPKLEIFRIFNILRQLEKVHKYTEYVAAENVSVLDWTQLKNDGDNIYPKLTRLNIIDDSNYKGFDRQHNLILGKLFDYIHNADLKKVILIYTISKTSHSKYMTNYCMSQKKCKDIHFQELTDESQQQLLQRPSICFQGKPMSLGEFLYIVNERADNIITPTFLNDIIYHDKTISLIKIDGGGNDVNGNSFYTHRRFHSQFFISRRIKNMLTNKSEISDGFIFCGVKNKQELVDILKVSVKKTNRIFNRENIVIIENQEEASSFFNNQSCVRALHLIKFEENRLLSWVSSKGSLEKLRKFVIRNNDVTVTESDLLKRKAVVLTGPSGIGKSTTLAMLRAYLQLAWIIHIDLSNCRDIILENIDRQTVIRFLSSCIEPHFLTSGLLNNFLFTASKLSVYILFDGFDEIAQTLDSLIYKSFMALLKFLNENSQAHIWITSRLENNEDIENALSEFSIRFGSISVEEQQDMLYNNCKTEKLKEDLLIRRNIAEFYKIHQKIISNRPSFLGLPLLLKILSDTEQLPFVSDIFLSESLTKSENFDKLFDKFTASKYQKCIQDYLLNNENDKEQIITYLDETHEFEACKFFCPGLEYLLGKPNNVFHVDISKVGFVSKTKDSTFQFVHRIFAEYFAARIIYKWMLNPINYRIEELDILKILLMPKFKIIRFFLDQVIYQHGPPEMPQCITDYLAKLWNQEKQYSFNKNGECIVQVFINENLSNLVHCIFQKKLIASFLRLFLTRYKLLNSNFISKIECYQWIPKLSEKLDVADHLNENIFKAVRNHKLSDLRTLFGSIEDVVVRTYILTSQCKSALHLAASLGFNDIVEYLVDIDMPIDILDNVNATPLQYAASNGHLDIVKFLKAKGANLNHRDNHLNTALSRCTKRGHLEVVKFLVEHCGIDNDALDRNGMSTLQHATKSGYIDIVKLLLGKGCNINHRDHFGMNALAWAVSAGDTDMVDFLIGMGADSSISDQNGRNLIHIAVKANQWHLVKYLTFCLIDVNIPDFNKVTPLDRAVKAGKWDMVEHLILEGAESANNKKNFNPILSAVEASEWPTVLLMISHGFPLTCITAEDKEKILDKIIALHASTYSLFYQVIIMGNVELLKLLIQRMEYNDPHKAVTLDRLLSEPYEELTLTNVHLSNEMKMFVETKLVQLRSTIGQKFKLSEENVTRRIYFVCEQIQMLKLKYFSENSCEVDPEFIIRSRFIAQNIELLKRSVRKTNIPWEQMEFCLVIFINFFVNPQREDFLYRLVLDKEKLITYLNNFSESLQFYLQNQDPLSTYLVNLEVDYRIIKDIYSLNRIAFYLNLALSIKNVQDELSPYVLMRCLQVIGESFKNSTDSPNLSNEVHEYLLFTAPTNVKRIVTSLRDSLSHSHTYRSKTEIENTLKCNPEYFQSIQNDLQKIRLQIDYLLFTKKKETLELFYQKCQEYGSKPNSQENINRYISWEADEEVTTEEYELRELVTIKELAEKLKQTMQYPDETEMLNKFLNEINNIVEEIYKGPKNIKVDYIQMLLDSKILNTVKNANRLHLPNIRLCNQIKAGVYQNAISILLNFLSLIETNDKFKYQRDTVRDICGHLFYIMKWDAHKVKSLQDIDSNLADKLDETNKNIISNVFVNLQNRLEAENDRNELKQHFLKKQKLHDEFNYIKQDTSKSVPLIEKLDITKRDKINLKKNLFKNNIQVFNNIIGNLDEYGKLLKSGNSEKIFNLLKAFCSSIGNANINNVINIFIEEEEIEFKTIFLGKLGILVKIINENENILNENLTLQSAVEILLLDIMEACKSKRAIVEYVISFDEFTPLLVGTALRNYLAHGNPLFDLLPFKPLKAIISCIRILQENKENLFATARQPAQYPMEWPLKNFTKYLNIINNMFKPVPNLKSEESAERFVKPCNVFNEHFLVALTLLKNNYARVRVTSTKNDDFFKEIVLDQVIINDNLQRFQIIFENRSQHSCKFILRAISAGALKIINHITNILLQPKQSFKKEHSSNLFYRLENIINTIIIWSALIIASGNGHDDEVHTLLNYIENTTQLNVKNVSNCNIHATIFNNIIKCLLLHGINLDKLIFNGVLGDYTEMCLMTALYLSATRGHHQVVKMLLKRDINMKITVKNGMSILHLAAEGGHKEVVRILLENHADVNAHNSDLDTPLHLAALKGHSATVKVLLQYEANINAQQEALFTPLHVSAMCGHAKVVKILLTHDANVDALTNRNLTPLHLAAQYNQMCVAKILLKYNANVNALDNCNKTPLDFAGVRGHEDLVKILLECINTTQGESTLHDAAAYGQAGVVKLLLTYQAIVDSRNKDNYTALHFASIFGNVEVVEVLLNHHANINATDADNLTSLHRSSLFGHKVVVKLLLEHEPDINAVTSAQITPLHLAAAHGYDEIVKLLLDYHANIDVSDNTGHTPLHVAALHGYEAVVKTLLDHHADIHALTVQQETPLHFSASEGHEANVKILLQHDANVNIQNANLFTPLLLAIQNNHEAIAKVLIEHNASVNATFLNQTTALHVCAEKGYVRLVNLLLENGGNINAETSDKYSPLHMAAVHGSDEVVTVLLENNAHIEAVTREQMTALYLSAAGGHVAIVNILLKYNASIEAVTKQHLTPLHIAVLKGHGKIVQLLLDNNANINATTEEQDTPLHLAAAEGYEGIAIILLNYKAKVNALGNCQCTPLYLAAQNGHEQIVKLLISRQANVNTQNGFLYTALHCSAVQGHEGVVKILLEHHANVNATTEFLDTPLHLCATTGHEEVVKILLHHGANVDAVRINQSTPLHLASKFGHLSVVKVLLKNHANVNALRTKPTSPNDKIPAIFRRNDMSYITKETALSIATEEGHQDVVTTLLCHGAIQGFQYRYPE